MSKYLEKKNILILCSVCLLMAVIGVCINFGFSFAQLQDDILLDRGDVENQVLFLSDISYSKAQVGWGNISFDKTQSNTPLTLVLNGSSTVFKKGIWAHATSSIEYDISAYKDYAYFTTYYGLNTSASNNGNGVKFYVYTSVDGKEWTLRTEENPAALKGPNNAGFVKIDIKDVNYIRLYANDNGSNASDHAVWADTKLIKEGYNDNIMVPVEEFDKVIKTKYTSGVVADDLKLMLLQRNFINRVGQYQLQSFVDKDPKNKETLEWFIYNEEALRLWTIGGRPNGSYERALQVLSDLYHTYKEDLANENVTSLGTKYKDLYLKMMLSLSLTHSANVGLWIDGRQYSNAVVRYQIYKQMHLNGQLDASMFENYTIDEMRGVMITNIDDEEILWLHDYSTKYSTTADRFNPYKYIRYTLGYSYYRPQYYLQENYMKWDQKYNLKKYNITYQSGKPKLWIVFEEGAVCGGLSKTAANLYGVWGYPARVVGQPGHAAYVYLYNAGGGKYAWQLANSVVTTGWANTTGSGINGWGTKYATNSGGIQSGSYLLLSQDAQNEYDKYEKAELILLLQDVYKNDRKKLEQLYRDALKEEIINLDAWIGLVDLYITDSTKKDEDFIALAEEIAEVYTYHPLPMYDLTRRIGSKISSAGYRSRLMMLQDETLRKATKATASNTIYHKEVPVIANAILGVVDSRVATFSFDGANAGKIVLSKQLQSAQVTWTYSIDGGKTWKECYEHSVQLSKEELASITAENDIKIHITGVPMTEANIYKIDIQKGVFPSGVVSIDDLENRVNGATDLMEWTTDLNGEWSSFADTNPTFRGDVRVYIRVLANGIYTMSEPVYFTFTTNVSSDTNRYIPRDTLKVTSVSGTSGGNKDNILDGDFNTSWHGPSFNFMTGQSYKNTYAIIELSKPRFISEIDYAPDAKATSLGNYPTGKARNLEIYVSMDGTNWTLAGQAKNLANNANIKKIVLDYPAEAKYVKVNCSAVWEHGLQHYFSIAVINLYENPSASIVPTAEVNYNIVKKTNKDVVAELVDENRPITVTNNGGKTTYTFTENGEFTFEFVDNNGHKGSATARVDWIDKTSPKAIVQFNTTNITNENVVATITFDKPNITILSKDVELATNPVDGSKTITFLENNSVELRFQDELGNIGTKVISVDWIDTEDPVADFEYSTTHLTDKEVVATLKPSEEVTITNNGGSDTYTFTNNGEFTFEFVDRAGNKGSATAKVNWIAKVPTYEIHYSTKDLTNGDVTVTLELEEGYRIFNNNSNKEYTFTESGTFNFQYRDENNHDGIIPVTVDWIDKTPPTAELKYDIFPGKVVVSVVNPSEEITFKEGNGIYIFTEVGSYDIIFYDKVGNEGKLTAIILSIETEEDNEKPTDPDDNKPSNPDDNKPENPDDNKPSNPDDNKPENPDDNKPSNPGDNKPENPGNTDRPSTPNGGTNKPNDSNQGNKPGVNPPNNPDDSNHEEVDPDKNNNKEEYKTEDIKIEIPKEALVEGATIHTGHFEISSELKDMVGKISEYFDIYMMNQDDQRMNVQTNDLIRIRIKRNKEKEFLGVYELINQKLVKLDYVLYDEEIEIFTKGLGKYVISYQEKQEQKSDNTVASKKNFLWIIASGIVVLIGAIGYFVKKKFKL